MFDNEKNGGIKKLKISVIEPNPNRNCIFINYFEKRLKIILNILPKNKPRNKLKGT